MKKCREQQQSYWGLTRVSARFDWALTSFGQSIKQLPHRSGLLRARLQRICEHVRMAARAFTRSRIALAALLAVQVDHWLQPAQS